MKSRQTGFLAAIIGFAVRRDRKKKRTRKRHAISQSDTNGDPFRRVKERVVLVCRAFARSADFRRVLRASRDVANEEIASCELRARRAGKRDGEKRAPMASGKGGRVKCVRHATLDTVRHRLCPAPLPRASFRSYPLGLSGLCIVLQ